MIAEYVPFDHNDPQERQMRVLVGNIRWMQRPHYAFVGTEDSPMKAMEAREEAELLKAPLQVIEVAGDHHSSLPTAIQRYLDVVQREQD